MVLKHASALVPLSITSDAPTFDPPTGMLTRVTRVTRRHRTVLLAYAPDDYGQAIAWATYRHLQRKGKNVLNMRCAALSPVAVYESYLARNRVDPTSFEVVSARQIIGLQIRQHIQRTTQAVFGETQTLSWENVVALGYLCSLRKLKERPSTAIDVSLPPPQPFNAVTIAEHFSQSQLGSVFSILHLLFDRGLITYPKTFGTDIPATVADGVRDVLIENEQACTGVAHIGNNAACVPVDMAYTPDKLHNRDIATVYRAIWSRTLCAGLGDATGRLTTGTRGSQALQLNACGWGRVGRRFDPRPERLKESTEYNHMNVFAKLYEVGFRDAWGIQTCLENLVGSKLLSERTLVPTAAGRAVNLLLQGHIPELYDSVKRTEDLLQSIRTESLGTADLAVANAQIPMSSMIMPLQAETCCNVKLTSRIVEGELYARCSVCGISTTGIIRHNTIRRRNG